MGDFMKMRRMFWGVASGAAMTMALPGAAKEKAKALAAACQNLSDVNEQDKKWFIEKLPDRTYKNAVEVKKALGLI